MITFILNNDKVGSSAPTGRVMLDVIRRQMRLTGTKEGCREGDCGACTILLGSLKNHGMDYMAVDSCLLPLGEVQGKHVVTIEGINGGELFPLQQAFANLGAVQCGFCTPGFIMALTGFLLNAGEWDEDEAITALAGNICRCTGYSGIRRAVGEICRQLRAVKNPDKNRLDLLVENGFLPEYLLQIPERLAQMTPPEPMTGASIIVAGGTDLYVQKPELLRERNVNLISNRPGMSGIRIEDGSVVIGAGVTTEELRTSSIIRQHVPTSAGFFKMISSMQIRHRATVAGNLVNASPIGDLSIWLLAMEAVLVLGNDQGRRELPLRQFFKGYKLVDRREDELIEAVRFPLPEKETRVNFEKVSKRTFMDIASVNTAMKISIRNDRIKDVHLSAGGVAPIPLYLEQTSAFLCDKIISLENVRAASEVADGEIKPISDVRGSEKYKRLLLRQLILAHFHSIPGWEAR